MSKPAVSAALVRINRIVALGLLLEASVIIIGAAFAARSAYVAGPHPGVPLILQNLWDADFNLVSGSQYSELAHPSASMRVFLWYSFLGFAILNLLVAALYARFAPTDQEVNKQTRARAPAHLGIGVLSFVVLAWGLFATRDYIGANGGGVYFGNARSGMWGLVLPLANGMLVLTTFYLSLTIFRALRFAR